MLCSRCSLLAVCAAVALALTAPAAIAGWPRDPNVNLPVCTAAANQQDVTMVSDGAGGVILAWTDGRSGSADIYAQRVNASGVPQWTANGVPLCTATNDQALPQITSDGVGGAIVTWFDGRSGPHDIYAQRVSAAGVPLWTANGVALCTAANGQEVVMIASDGTGGAIVTWEDSRTGFGFGPDIYAQRVSAAGVPQWTPNGVALCTAAGAQYQPQIVSDLAAGAVVTWLDGRSGPLDIYVQRVSAAGVPLWTADGVALCTAAGYQRFAKIVSNGTGGAIVTWEDERSGFGPDIYAREVSAGGVPLWTADGVALCTAAFAQQSPEIASDGVFGAIVTWFDQRGGDYDIYAQRVDMLGMPLWTADGVALCTVPYDQAIPRIASDEAGGAIVIWEDGRSGFGAAQDIYAQRVNAAGVAQWTLNGVAVCTAAGPLRPTVVSAGTVIAWNDFRSGFGDIYAQRIGSTGRLGSPEPEISRVADVPNDQGGRVQVEWSASYLDVFPIFDVASYSIWRRVPNLPTAPGPARRTPITTTQQGQAVYWEYVASQPARGFPGYSYVAATTSDSLSGSNPYTAFLVMAELMVPEPGSGIQYWSSDPDSGYSVDNIAPSAPSSFTAQYFTGSPPSSSAAGTFSPGYTWLHWSPSPEPDFLEYRLHRGTSVDFAPGRGNLLVAKADTGYIDVGPAGGYYKLLAVDSHDNASVSSVLTPDDIVGVGMGTAPASVWLGPASPNPFRETTSFRFGLPHGARVTLAVFDVGGRKVRDLASGWMPAGSHSVSWDGRDESGRALPSALYVYRLEVEGRSLARSVLPIH